MSISLLKIVFFNTALFFSIAVSANNEFLHIYAEEYFATKNGAGSIILEKFQQDFPQCKVKLTAFDSRTTMFNRLRLENNRSKADIVVGLDNHQLYQAEQSGLFAENKVDLQQLDLPILWKNTVFLPYDFSQYAFIYKPSKLTNPPNTLQELIEREDLRIIYQDPRTSSIGRGLIVWLNQIYSAEQIPKIWQQLAKHTITVGKGWSETYGAFLRGEADLVLSNNTSPLYHLLAEQNNDFAATNFPEGQILQIELAAKTMHSQHPCGDIFLNYLLTPASQREIALRTVMLPVIKENVEPHYDELKSAVLKTRNLDTQNLTDSTLKLWINQWQQVLSE